MSTVTQAQIGFIKTIAAYLDPHVLLAFLKSHAPGTERVQEQIADKTLIAKKDSWDKVEDEFKNNKLLSLLNNHHEYQRLRQEKGFTLERLNEDRGITIADCKKVFQFAKMQYEMGKYKDAEKFLFALKEILTTEQYTQTEFCLQIFWGLLNCEILLQREKETLEFTTLRKMKDFIEKLLTDQAHNYQENMNHKSWLLHQVLVYSFTNPSHSDRRSNPMSLFGQILVDRSQVGQGYLNIVQIRCQYLLKYLIASLVVSGNFEAIGEILLPVIQQEKSKYSDVYTRFVETVYEQFDFTAALAMTKELAAAAQEDLLLKAHAAEIQAQAVLLIYQVKSKLYKTINLQEVVEVSGIKSEEEVRSRFEENFKREGVSIEYSGHTLSIVGQLKDQKAKIFNKTTDLVKRTNQLYQHYQQQMIFLNDNLGGKQ